MRAFAALPSIPLELVRRAQRAVDVGLHGRVARHRHIELQRETAFGGLVVDIVRAGRVDERDAHVFGARQRGQRHLDAQRARYRRGRGALRARRLALGDGLSGDGDVTTGAIVGVGVGKGVGVGGVPPLTCRITLSLEPSGWPGNGSCATTMPRGFESFATGNHIGGPSVTPASFAADWEKPIDKPMKFGT